MSGLDDKLGFHAGGCGKYFNRECDCLSREARAELSALRAAQAIKDARIAELLEDRMTLRNHLRGIAEGNWGEGSRSLARALAEYEDYPKAWRDEGRDVMQEALTASSDQITSLESVLAELLVTDGGEGSDCWSASRHYDARRRALELLGISAAGMKISESRAALKRAGEGCGE